MDFKTGVSQHVDECPRGMGKQQVNPKPCPSTTYRGECGTQAGAGEVRGTVSDRAAHCHGELGEARTADQKSGGRRAKNVMAHREGELGEGAAGKYERREMKGQRQKGKEEEYEVPL